MSNVLLNKSVPFLCVCAPRQKSELNGKNRFIRRIDFIKTRYIAVVAKFCEQRGEVNRDRIADQESGRWESKGVFIYTRITGTAADDLSYGDSVVINRIKS